MSMRDKLEAIAEPCDLFPNLPPTLDCRWMQDEICVNADCPMRADYCPVPDIEGVCRFEERGAEDG